MRPYIFDDDDNVVMVVRPPKQDFGGLLTLFLNKFGVVPPLPCQGRHEKDNGVDIFPDLWSESSDSNKLLMRGGLH